MVYVHVPFCRSFCTYCGFYSEVCRGTAGMEAYVRDVCREAAMRADEIRATRETDTLYIGGGTPSVLPLSALGEIVGAVRDAAGRPSGIPSERTALRTPETPEGFAEFTVEVNPEDIVEKGETYARGLRSLGVNRISMGVQSFDDGILRWMNRRHTADRAVEAFRILRAAGFGNISIDLIFGLPRLSDAEWERTVGQALALAPEHISAYQLSVEEGSALAGRVEAGLEAEASDGQCRRQYDILCRCLADAGYRHYEISNFARPGFEARHNSAYWRRVPYVGLGPGAHSFLPAGGAFASAAKTADGTACAESGAHRGTAGEEASREKDGGVPGAGCGAVRRWNSETPAGWSASEERLDEEDVRVETLMLGLRTDRGLPAEQVYALAAPGTAERLLAEGALTEFEVSREAVPTETCFPTDGGLSAAPGTAEADRRERRIRIPEDRFFVSDEIIRELV